MAKRRTRVKMSVGKILALKPDEIEKMSTAKLKAITTILNSAANKRVKRAEKLGTESAVIDKAKQGGRFITPRFGKKTPEEEQRSKILSSFMRARDFMTKETSSTRGVKKTQKKVIKQFIKQAKKITLPSGSGEEYTPWFMDLKKIDKEKINELVWKSVDKFAEANPLTKEGRYRVANVAYELVTGDKPITDKDSLFKMLEDWAQEDYEQSVQEFEDVGDEDIAALFKDFTGI